MNLAIDTSTDNASLALVFADSVIFEITWRCGQNHTVEFLSRLSDLMTRHGIDNKEIKTISVAIGPGSFSGTRVGLSIAKGLAYSLGIPVVGISTLSITAYPFAVTGLPVCAVLNAGRSELAAATYRMSGNEWQQLVAEHVTTLETLLNEIKEKTVFCGELTSPVIEQIRTTLAGNAVIPDSSARLRRAAYLAELGQKRLDRGEQDDPATLQPIYLRRPNITKPKKEYGSL